MTHVDPSTRAKLLFTRIGIQTSAFADPLAPGFLAVMRTADGPYSGIRIPKQGNPRRLGRREIHIMSVSCASATDAWELKAHCIVAWFLQSLMISNHSHRNEGKYRGQAYYHRKRAGVFDQKMNVIRGDHII
jgi:hypothetical protein